MDNQMNQYDNGGGYNNGSGGSPGNNGGGGGNQPPRRPNIMMVLLAALSTLLLVFMLWNLLFGGSGNTQEVSYTKFLEYVNEDQVEAVEVQSTGQVLFTLKNEEKETDSVPTPCRDILFTETRRSLIPPSSWRTWTPLRPGWRSME